jgi:uncharacterized membrane protein YqaE (UPF0057 family)
MKTILKKTFLLLVGCGIFSSALLNAAVPVPTSPGAVTTAPEPTPKPSIKEILGSFKKLSRKEKKERFREVKKELKEYRKLKRSGAEPLADQTLIIILAILLPPLGVYLYEGEINSKFWISLVLTLLFWLPGAIYSLLVVTDTID